MQALAIIYADQGKLDLAVKTLEKANLFKPNDPTILNNLGFIYLSLGQCSDAQDILQSAIELDGTQVQYRNNLAFSHVCNNDLDTALSLLRSTCSEAEARYNLGVGYELQKNEETAKEQYRLALEVNPNHSLAKHALDRLKSGARPSDLEQEEL
jgi:Flp pilus assembly protein TadD